MKEDSKFVKKVHIEFLEDLVKQAGLELDKDKCWEDGQDNYRIFSSEKNPRFLGRVYLTEDGKNVRSVQINYRWRLPSKVYQSIFSFYGVLYENNIQRKIILPSCQL